MPIQKIIFTGDILRVNASGKSDQWTNIGWLRRLLSPAIKIAVQNCTVEEVSWVNGVSAFDGSMIYAAHGMPADAQSWAVLFYSAPNDLALAYMSHFFQGSLVIGFELSPYLRAALDVIGVDYIDLCIHPIRYMEDLMIYASSNNGSLASALSSYALSDVDLHLRSSFLAAAWRSQGFIQPRKHTAAMLCLQTARDRVVIGDDCRFRSIEMYLDEVLALRESVDRLYVKPHPHEKDLSSLNVVVDAIPRVEIISTNFYAILARSDVDLVVSLSSGTTTEAMFLGARGRHLFRDFYEHEGNLAGGSPFYPLMDDFLWPDFWRTVLSNQFSVSPKGGYRRSTTTGTLRRSLGQSWDFAKWL